MPPERERLRLPRFPRLPRSSRSEVVSSAVEVDPFVSDVKIDFTQPNNPPETLGCGSGFETRASVLIFRARLASCANCFSRDGRNSCTDELRGFSSTSSKRRRCLGASSSASGVSSATGSIASGADSSPGISGFSSSNERSGRRSRSCPRSRSRSLSRPRPRFPSRSRSLPPRPRPPRSRSRSPESESERRGRSDVSSVEPDARDGSTVARTGRLSRRRTASSGATPSANAGDSVVSAFGEFPAAFPMRE